MISHSESNLSEVREKIFRNIKEVRERIERACERAKRDISEIKLVAVSKTFPPDFISFAYEAGIRDFGENYAQEALPKINALKGYNITWHFVGHLQKNKAKFIPGNFDYLHSLDSIELLKELEKRVIAAREKDKESKKADFKLNTLVQVNIGTESTKKGVEPEKVLSFFEKILEIKPKYVKISGLMIIPPQPKNPEDSRKYFKEIVKIKEYCLKKGIPHDMLKEISAGMSDDFEVAIEEGATIVRIGRAIFFEREKKEKTIS